MVLHRTERDDKKHRFYLIMNMALSVPSGAVAKTIAKINGQCKWFGGLLASAQSARIDREYQNIHNN